MKSVVILLACISVNLQLSICTSVAGPFKLLVESVDDKKELKESCKDVATWKWYCTRISRNEKGVVGSITLKKPVVNPRIDFQTEVLSSSHYIPVRLESLRSVSLCSEKIKKRYLTKAFTGDAKITKDCVLTEGTMILRKDFNLDAAIHQAFDKYIYGTYKIMGLIRDQNNVTIAGLDLTIHIKEI